MNIDIKALAQSFGDQFRGLNGRHPGMWPLGPRIVCAIGVTVGVVALGWFGYWSGQFEDQDRLAQQEQKLRDEYRVKVAQAVNLPALEAQRAQVGQYVEGLEKQLPSKADMDALLSDINQAGVGRGLQFELFRPGVVVLRDYYAELPIDIRISGSYHDVGAFASDMAHLPRIVTLNNMTLTTGKDGTLTLDAVAKTFRYLDPDEAAAQRQARLNEKKAKKGARK
jgi:type IV pilus assembly protein PilO